jgi:hypothetical protein
MAHVSFPEEGKVSEYTEVIPVRLSPEQVSDLDVLRNEQEPRKLARSAMVRVALAEYIVRHLQREQS